MLEIKKVIKDSMGIMRLSGSLDFHTSAQLRKELEDILAEGFSTLLLNLKDLQVLDSSGIGMLLLAAKEMEKRSGRIIIIANALVWELLDVTRLTGLFERASSEEEARAMAAKSA